MARLELQGSFSLFVFLVPALDAKSYALWLRRLPSGDVFMSLNLSCTSNEIVNRHRNRFSLTRKSSQYFFGREMVGPQFRFREHIPIISKGRFAQYSWRNSHANARAAFQTVAPDLRREAERVSPRAPVLFRIRSLDIGTDDSERALPEDESSLHIE